MHRSESSRTNKRGVRRELWSGRGIVPEGRTIPAYMIGMALGGWQGGLFYDLNGDYVRAFLNSSIAGVINLLILGLPYLHTERWAPRLRVA